MNNFKFFLLGLFIFVSGVCSDETNLLEVVMKECNFSKVYNTSLIDTIRNETEFKECKNWTAITSIKSSEQFAEDNMSNIRCLLYYESLVPICKNESNLENLQELLIASPKYTYIEDFCVNLLSSESQTIRNVITDKSLCDHLCTEYQNGKPSLNMVCVKSYNFIKFLQDMKKSQTSIADENVNKVSKGDVLDAEKKQNETPIDVSPSPEESGPKQSNNIVPAQNKANQDVLSVEQEEKPILNRNAEKPSTAVSDSIDSNVKQVDQANNIRKGDQLIDSPSSQKPEVLNNVPAQAKGRQGDTLSVNPSEVQNNDKPVGDELAPPSKNSLINSVSKSSTVANDQLSKVQNVQEVKPKVDLDTETIDADNAQQAPKFDDPNIPPGEDYDVEQEKTEQVNELKQADTLREADPDDAVPDLDKMPKVSQLSDRFGYDADVNGNSNFFTYFSFTCVIFVIGYVVYHNKTKVLALLVEGRHSRRTQRVRRPNIANYQKLDSNLEEAISSSVSKNPSHVIY